MNGKQLVIESIKGNTTPRPAWVPFVGVHAGHLIGETARDYLQSPELMLKGIETAIEKYSPDGIPVCFDLQLEAELLGCNLQWADEAPPAVSSHPLASGIDTAKLPAFTPHTGRLQNMLDLTKTLSDKYGEDLALYGLLCGPFTLAMHLAGNNIFLAMFDEPETVKELLEYCTDVACKTAAAYIESGADVIAIVDPMTSQISPDHFREFVTPYVNRVFDLVKEQGAHSSLFVCGDATRNLEEMCATHADNVSIDENIPLELVRDLARNADKSFGGNLKLTLVLLLGTEDDAKLDTIRCMDTGGTTGFVLAPGCDLPYGVPEANVAAVAKIATDPYALNVARETAKASAMPDAVADLPESYADQPGIQIDVITLNSASCAPCQYMMEAVERAAADLDGQITVKEHKITGFDGLAAMMKLGVEHIPTICIEGKTAFSSVIPDQPTLRKSFADALAAKA